MRRLTVFLLVSAGLALVSPPVEAGDVPPGYVPPATCLGIEHFPDDPVDGAPSAASVGALLDGLVMPEELVVSISGASGDLSASAFVDTDVALVRLPLYAYGAHTITDAYVTTESGDVPIDPGLIAPGGAFVVDDDQPVCDESLLRSLAPAPTTTTTTTTTTTSVPVETTAPTATAAPTSAVPATTASTVATTAAATSPASVADDGDEGGGGGAGPAILIGAGAGLLIAGGALVAGRRERDCERERADVAAARQRWGEINEVLEEALADLTAHEGSLAELERELADLERDTDRGSAGTGTDRVHAVDGAPMSARAVEIERDYLNGLIDIERRAAQADEARVQEWHQRFEDAAEEVRAAEMALAECEGATAPPAPTPAPAPPGGPTEPTPPPSGPGVVTTPPSVSSTPRRPECENGAVYVAPAGRAETFLQVVDFSVIVQVVEGSERKVGEANVMSWNLASAGANLDALGSLLGAAGAGESITQGLGGIGQGSYVMGAGGLVKGGAEAAMASGLTEIAIPTSPPEAIVEVVEQVAKLGALVSAKVGEWLGKNQLYDVRLTLFHQSVIATPYHVSTCVDGRWQCRKVWQYDIGPLRRHGRTNSQTFRRSSDVNIRRMETRINSLGNQGRSHVTRALQRRAEFDARHQPGACE